MSRLSPGLPTKRTARVLLTVLCGVLLLLLLNGYLTAANNVSDRYQNAASQVEPRSDITVVTTSPRKSADASLVAFAPNGSVLYYNETYDWYFDVDPVAGTNATVEYVAVGLVTENCDRRSRISRNNACSRNVVERVNLTTGEITRVYSFLTRPVSVGGWHDVDRIDDSRLLVAGSTNNRVFTVNTSSRIVTWQWDVQSAFDAGSGGLFPSDWAHTNDVSYLDDGRIMASLRNHDQVVFLDPRTGLRSNWTLGTDDDHATLFEQHNPDYIPAELGGPAVLVSDSHNNRIVEYQRTAAGEWERTWAWRDLDLQWPRDADRLPNGHTLFTDSNGNRVFEIDRNGEIGWEIPVDTPYEAERLGTGDESSGGASARRLGLSTRTVEQTEQVSSLAISAQILRTARNTLPPLAINGLIFLLPTWVTVVDLLVLLALGSVVCVWVALELTWSPYSITFSIERR
jgi:hypothetical protein